MKQVDEAQQDTSSSEKQDPANTDDATNSDGVQVDGDKEEEQAAGGDGDGDVESQ